MKGGAVMKQLPSRLLITAIFIIILVFLFPNASYAQRCEEWVAKIVSVQGRVEVKKAGETEWISVKLNDTFCTNDMIRAQKRSRAAFVLPNQVILRLDEKTTIIFNGVEKKRTSLLEMLKGAAHFFSRKPYNLKLATPFVNGSIEGTEFFVRVETHHTFMSIFEGRVVTVNEAGTLTIASGQSAIAERGKAPELRTVVRPRDAVRWALYYPPIIDYRPIDFKGEADWQGMARKSIGFYWEGNFSEAFSSLEGIPEDIRDPHLFTYRAMLLLSVGRVEEAEANIEKALSLDPGNSRAIGLKAIISVVQNKKERALELARKAVELDPKSSSARVALSYAEQANFAIEGALKSLQEAVKLDSKNALAWARLSELWLSVGNLDKALEVAKKAVALNPRLARTQTVLGFAYLTQIKTRSSKNAFKTAIELDQAAPLPRLGLGLAKIRDGDLKEGRAEIEIAASLDPNNSLIRSYLGKAYFEEKEDKYARSQFSIAKELDPLDPTPYFYDAIQKQTTNRPVEALQDLQKSIELNNNRAVYRSKLLLDEDLAARSASLSQIYSDLGFEQLASVEAWKSLHTDPTNFSAHRFLADLLSRRPRHEVSRVSEILQSQLLQPINITPVQPQFSESDLLIREGEGPASPSFNEFNPLFTRNRLAFQGSAFGGRDSTYGDEPVHSAVLGNISYSVGRFHYETDGFRDNNDLEEDIYNGFVQMSLSHKTSIQAEFRYKELTKGHLPLFFDRDNFDSAFRQDERFATSRFGLHHAFTPNSDLLVSFIYQDADFDTLSVNVPEVIRVDDATDEDGYIGEAQYLFRSERINVIMGAGFTNIERGDLTTTWMAGFPPIIPESITREETETTRHHTNIHLYSYLNYPKSITWTIGGSADLLKDSPSDRDRLNPKFGVIWNPFPNTMIRGAAFRAMKRSLVANQSLEPTQVAGFNQFFDDANGSLHWGYGVGADQKFTSFLYGGVECTWRDIEEPKTITEAGGSSIIVQEGLNESTSRAYIYLTPHKWFSLSGEYFYERFERPNEDNVLELSNVDTHKLSLGFNFFHPSGLTVKLKPIYVDQEGKFKDASENTLISGDQFWVIDGSISYRLPKRYGLITVGARNLFGEPIQFQDTDFNNPTIYPDQMVFAKITLAF